MTSLAIFSVAEMPTTYSRNLPISEENKLGSRKKFPVGTETQGHLSSSQTSSHLSHATQNWDKEWVTFTPSWTPKHLHHPSPPEVEIRESVGGRIGRCTIQRGCKNLPNFEETCFDLVSEQGTVVQKQTGDETHLGVEEKSLCPHSTGSISKAMKGLVGGATAGAAGPQQSTRPTTWSELNQHAQPGQGRSKTGPRTHG